ncbi:MAG TPA: hypothetical protein VEL72_06655, partial [Ktedonobacteraceae bacterium]|nr:hypothetical protein [Ktedonobacteraceae bacterium]
CNGINVFSCVASGRGLRRAIGLLLLCVFNLPFLSGYTSCQPEFAIQRFFLSSAFLLSFLLFLPSLTSSTSGSE